MIASCAPAAAQGESEGFPDLESLYGVPWTPTWPTAPTINSEQIVTPANIGTYIGTDNLRLILSAGTYAGLTLNQQDQEFVIQSNVTVGTVEPQAAMRRTILRFETPCDATSVIGKIYSGTGEAALQDLLINGVNSTCTGANH